jgi:hypothetical protein
MIFALIGLLTNKGRIIIKQQRQIFNEFKWKIEILNRFQF